jgi:hypothetical protein
MPEREARGTERMAAQRQSHDKAITTKISELRNPVCSKLTIFYRDTAVTVRRVVHDIPRAG